MLNDIISERAENVEKSLRDYKGYRYYADRLIRKLDIQSMHPEVKMKLIYTPMLNLGHRLRYSDDGKSRGHQSFWCYKRGYNQGCSICGYYLAMHYIRFDFLEESAMLKPKEMTFVKNISIKIGLEILLKLAHKGCDNCNLELAKIKNGEYNMFSLEANEEQKAMITGLKEVDPKKVWRLY